MDIETKNEADEIKKEGNGFFKLGDWQGAIEKYSLAIEHYDKEASYFGNRAQCYLKLKKYHQCINDCKKALIIDPTFFKAYMRKG